MSAKAKCQPVSFEEVKAMSEEVLKLIESFEQGNFLSKNKADQKLKEYRQVLSKLSKSVAGARLFTFDLGAKLVKREDLEFPVVTETKVEVPE